MRLPAPRPDARFGPRPRRRLAIAATAVLSATALLGGSLAPSVADAAPAPAVVPTVAPAAKPNFVFVLTDDLEPSLLRFMPTVRAMQAAGANFKQYQVSDTLCCPSRASIFTGQYPHTSKIFTNTAPDGGYAAFKSRGLEQQTYAVSLQNAGYRTGFMGKYLNGYDPKAGNGTPGANVPPGWNDWRVAGNGYGGFNYTLNENGREVAYGKKASDYLTDVLSVKGQRFIVDAAAAKKPFALEIATFLPHAPFTPAPRDAKKYPKLKAPRTPAFNERNVSDKPGWLRKQPRLTKKQIKTIDTNYRKRARSVRSIDLMIKRLRDTLRATGQLNNTYVVFSSDNGFHLGEHRLPGGKQTAFKTDLIVPLVVTGPNVRRGTRTAVAQNVDLAPTFVELGGGAPLAQADGRSLAGVLRSSAPANWRSYGLVEHHGPNARAGDPDRPGRRAANPPTYAALSNADSTYVSYVTGAREYYDNRKDPHQLQNRYSTLSAARKAALAAALAKLRTCSGPQQCAVR